MTFRNTNILFGLIVLGLLVYDLQNNVSNLIYTGVILLYGLIVFWGTINISLQFFGPAKCKGNESSASVALTFDDGPAPQATNKILEVLKKENIKATFFCIGKHVKDNPDLIRDIDQDGHLIGNHSFYHGPFFDLQPRKKMVSEINNTNAVIAEATGRLPRFFRPPYGVINPMLASAIHKSKMVNVGWSIRSFDTTASDKSKLLERVTKNLKGGDVILFHDRCALTAEILPDLLSYISKSGLKVELLDKVLGEKAYV